MTINQSLYSGPIRQPSRAINPDRFDGDRFDPKRPVWGANESIGRSGSRFLYNLAEPIPLRYVYPVQVPLQRISALLWRAKRWEVHWLASLATYEVTESEDGDVTYATLASLNWNADGVEASIATTYTPDPSHVSASGTVSAAIRPSYQHGNVEHYAAASTSAAPISTLCQTHQDSISKRMCGIYEGDRGRFSKPTRLRSGPQINQNGLFSAEGISGVRCRCSLQLDAFPLAREGRRWYPALGTESWSLGSWMDRPFSLLPQSLVEVNDSPAVFPGTYRIKLDGSTLGEAEVFVYCDAAVTSAALLLELCCFTE